jgi:glycosyltransferase involved in cell wall biosynthesis
MQAEHLAAVGHTSVVVTCAGDGELPGAREEGGVIIRRVRALNTFDTRLGVPFPVCGIGLIKTLVKEIKIADAVHLHDVFYMTSWAAYVLSFFYRKPLFLTQHVGLVAHPSRLIVFIQRIVYRTFGVGIFNYAKRIIVYNLHVRDFLISQKVPANRILELKNGIDIEYFHPSTFEERNAAKKEFGLPINRPLVLFVGRLVPKKGYDILYEAQDDSFDLVYVGSGTVPSSWVTSPHFHFLGPRTRHELAKLYALADLFVAPSEGEIFTLVMQEAMACGTPVIATSEPGYAEYSLDGEGICFSSRTTEALKEHILSILSDPKRLASMSAYSRAFACEHFSWSKNFSPILELYAALERVQTDVVVTTSWDDGHVLDLKLAKLLKDYGIQGTFYVAPHDCELSTEARLTQQGILDLAKDFEIGAHTMTHRHLPGLSSDAAKQEISGSKQYLETLIGREVTSFCYPAGKYSPRDVALVRGAGYRYARTVERFSIKPLSDPFTCQTTIHTYSHWSDVFSLLRAVRYNPLTFFRTYKRWDAQAMILFDRVLRDGGVFHLWGHSWEVDAHNDWERLRRVLAYIGHRPHVRYVSNSESLSVCM